MKKIVIIGTSLCNPCKKSIALAKSFIADRRQDVELESYNVDLGEISKEEAFKIAGGPFVNVPVIVVDGVNIGGFEDLRKIILKEVELDESRS